MEPQRPLLAVVLVLGALIVAACAGPDRPATKTSSAPPVTESPAPLGESFTKYEGLRVELIAALEQKLPGISWTVEQPATLARLADGRCMFYPQTMKSSADVVEPSHRFADIFSAADPILARYGFPPFGGTDAVPGGWTVARSTDPAGATLSVESKSPAYLRISAPVDSATCDPAELPGA
ncbi:hypothetical protein ACTAQI_00720 [Pseudarthrobacter sp. alpha12b]